MHPLPSASVYFTFEPQLALHLNIKQAAARTTLLLLCLLHSFAFCLTFFPHWHSHNFLSLCDCVPLSLSHTHTNTFTQTSLHCWGNESICTARCALSGAFDPRQRSALYFATGDTATKVLQTFIFSSFHCAATAVTLVSCHGLGRRDALSCCHFTVIVLSYTDLLNFSNL